MPTAPSSVSLAHSALDAGRGIVRLAPAWVPRVFCIPGQRIRLHPDDTYALGMARGGINERWFASTTPADNGPLTGADEGLSFIIHDGGRVSLRDAVADLGPALIGERLWKTSGAWPMYSKFFDNTNPLPFHIHQRDEHAARVGRKGKPEAYYFPPQANNHGGHFPHTYFGLQPGTTKDQVREALVAYTKGDNRITALSQAYPLIPGTGWDVPAGVLHAPGSLCTYEPQAASDVFAVFESLVDQRPMEEDLLWRDSPAEVRGDVDYLVDLIDWDLNTDPDFAANRHQKPKAKASGPGWIDRWVCWKSPCFSASELTVAPGGDAVIRDGGAYGFIVMQGHGRVGVHEVEAPALIRYGQDTADEFFVSDQAARDGVRIVNPSRCDPLVLLKHFGPGNPDLG